MKGRISKSFTVWCGRCPNWADLPDVSRTNPPTKAARYCGFRPNKEFKWLCADCLSELGIAPPAESGQEARFPGAVATPIDDFVRPR